jgi:hypothetical protein
MDELKAVAKRILNYGTCATIHVHLDEALRRGK